MTCNLTIHERLRRVAMISDLLLAGTTYAYNSKTEHDIHRFYYRTDKMDARKRVN